MLESCPQYLLKIRNTVEGEAHYAPIVIRSLRLVMSDPTELALCPVAALKAYNAYARHESPQHSRFPISPWKWQPSFKGDYFHLGGQTLKASLLGGYWFGCPHCRNKCARSLSAGPHRLWCKPCCPFRYSEDCNLGHALHVHLTLPARYVWDSGTACPVFMCGGGAGALLTRHGNCFFDQGIRYSPHNLSWSRPCHWFG